MALNSLLEILKSFKLQIFILLLFEDFKFWKKKKARRKYEKENNLPKKIMLHPILKLLLLGLILFFLVKLIIGFFYISDIGKNRTITKISEIENILKKLGKKPWFIS